MLQSDPCIDTDGLKVSLLSPEEGRDKQALNAVSYGVKEISVVQRTQCWTKDLETLGISSLKPLDDVQRSVSAFGSQL